MDELLHNNEYLEFFVEGGRTRSGKSVYPKGGLLSLVVDAYHNGQCQCSINLRFCAELYVALNIPYCFGYFKKQKCHCSYIVMIYNSLDATGVHSLFHSGLFYGTSSRPRLPRGVPDTARMLCRRHRQL